MVSLDKPGQTLLRIVGNSNRANVAVRPKVLLSANQSGKWAFDVEQQLSQAREYETQIQQNDLDLATMKLRYIGKFCQTTGDVK
ncbi:hypothetical protein E4U13_004978 [Claviceps humidiphila]|uniref:Uncharacterized protein n=1 Tax=Claviceps humidiphila TaxID=1294629 RepID=A0A9P7TYC6_9HYPO|nr:hypothetical protein E4U13_004978 [Claviceps humidiphila]